MATCNITLPEDLLPQLEELARAEHSSADAVAVEAIKQHIARRFWERNKLEAARRRGTLNDDEVEECVDRLIHETRSVSKPS
jgi:predicted transcriptional regulator